MDWLTKLFSGSAARGGAAQDANVLWLYVQCDRCGAVLAVRVDRRNEISPDYESGGSVLRKEMMDGKCFQLMFAELHFDAQGNVTERHVEHGKFLTRAEYDAAKKA